MMLTSRKRQWINKNEGEERKCANIEDKINLNHSKGPYN